MQLARNPKLIDRVIPTRRASFDVAQSLAAEQRQHIAWGVSPRNTGQNARLAAERRQQMWLTIRSCRRSAALMWLGRMPLLRSWRMRNTKKLASERRGAVVDEATSPEARTSHRDSLPRPLQRYATK